MKTALITGGSNGIGAYLCDAYLHSGFRVLSVDIDQIKGKQQFKKWQEQSLPGHFFACDLTSISEIENLKDNIKKQFSTIDVLINNAGKGITKPMESLTISEFDEVIHLNLRAAFMLSQFFVSLHQKNTYGRIINIASTRYLMSEPNTEAYAASKGGLVSLTHALALSLQSPFVSVNAIVPGWIHTGHPSDLFTEDHAQHPSKRVGTPKDIARTCLFLCEEGNEFITGQTITVDGGMTKKMIYVE